MRDKLNQMIRSSSFAKNLQDSIITMRGDRYCIPVKAECRANVPGLVHDQSASGATLFIEPMFVVELGNDLKQLYAREQQEIDPHPAGPVRFAGPLRRGAGGQSGAAAGIGFCLCQGPAGPPDAGRAAEDQPGGTAEDRPGTASPHRPGKGGAHRSVAGRRTLPP